MRYLVLFLLLLGAHFSLTPFAPAPKAWSGWPFSVESRSWLSFVGGLPSQSGGLATPVLAGLAGLGFLAAALGLFWSAIPAGAWPLIVVGSAIASGLLYVLYIGLWAILPLLLDALLVWGVLGWIGRSPPCAAGKRGPLWRSLRPQPGADAGGAGRRAPRARGGAEQFGSLPAALTMRAPVARGGARPP